MSIVALATVVLAAGFVHGLVGFGFGMLSMSLLTATHGLVHAAGVVNGFGVILAVSLTIWLRRHITWSEVRLVLPSAAVGIVLGVLALDRLPAAAMTRALGVVIVLFSLWNLWKGGTFEKPLPRPWAVAAGLSSGILGGAMNVGGPPLIAWFYSQPRHPMTNKANVQVMFACMSTVRMTTAISQGQIDGDVLRDIATAIPMLGVALWLGMTASRRISPGHFRRISWACFGALGAWLAIQAG